MALAKLGENRGEKFHWEHNEFSLGHFEIISKNGHNYFPPCIHTSLQWDFAAVTTKKWNLFQLSSPIPWIWAGHYTRLGPCHAEEVLGLGSRGPEHFYSFSWYHVAPTWASIAWPTSGWKTVCSGDKPPWPRPSQTSQAVDHRHMSESSQR